MIQVALLDGRIIGYAKASWFDPAAGAPDPVADSSAPGRIEAAAGAAAVPERAGPDSSAPAGWYLLGVIVHPDFRRRGVGLALTRSRLEWIAGHSDRAYYFANVRNLVSIEMHRKLGFVERTLDVRIPGVTFTGGVGALFALILTSP